MKVGVALPHYGNDLSLGRLVEIAQECERLGFDSVWLSDHVVFDLAKYGGSNELIGSFEPLTTLAVLSRETTRVRLGTMVLCNEFRHPLMVAKQAVSIPRLELGLGAGWYEREFGVAGIDYPPVRVRMERLRESVEILKLAFTGNPVDYRGRHYVVQDFVLGASIEANLWVGGKGPRMIDLIGSLGVGWNAAWFNDPDSYESLLAQAPKRRSIGQYARGSAGEMLDRIRAFEALGVVHTIMCFSSVPFGLDDPDDLSRFAQDVLPHVH